MDPSNLIQEFFAAVEREDLCGARRALRALENLLPPPTDPRRGTAILEIACQRLREFMAQWAWTLAPEFGALMVHTWYLAVERNDVDSLRLVMAVVRKGWKDPAQIRELDRYSIELLKDILKVRSDLQGVPARLELSKLAELVSHQSSSSEYDGHSALRRLAKELQFPIAAGQRGNPHRV
jgi:hypothetical protein